MIKCFINKIGTFEVTSQYFAYFISISSLVFENDKWTFGAALGISICLTLMIEQKDKISFIFRLYLFIKNTPTIYHIRHTHGFFQDFPFHNHKIHEKMIFTDAVAKQWPWLSVLNK